MIGYTWGKIKGSVSGWEKSHFGGYYKMITDYPYIKLNLDIQIEIPKDRCKELGGYASEKLIKLFLIKANNYGLTSHFDTETITKKDFLGREKKYIKMNLNSNNILDIVMQNEEEYAPLFSHYKDIILNTHLLKEIKEDPESSDETQEDGEDKKDEDKSNGSGGEDPSSSDDSNKKKSKSASTETSAQEIAEQEMLKQLKEIKESKPYDWKNSLSTFNETPVFKSCPKHYSEYRFSNQEIRDAENLFKMLDISFEPKSDIVKSLRAGKLDVCKIAEVPAGSTSIYKQTVEDQDTRPFAVCILADLSGSMQSGIKVKMQKHVLNVLYLTMSQIVPNDKLWIYGHTGDDNPDIWPFYTPYDTEYTKNIKHYDSGSLYWCQNYDGPVIEAIHKKIRETCEDRVIFISLSDGSPCGEHYGSSDDIVEMQRIMERARRDDFVTVGVGMEYIAHDGLYTYSTSVQDMQTFVKDVSSIVNRVVHTEFK